MATNQGVRIIKQSQQQAGSRAKFSSRQWMWISIWIIFMMFVLTCFVVSNELLYSYFKRTEVVNRVRTHVSNDTLLTLSESNPEAMTERRRIKLLMDRSQFGKISIRDILYSSHTNRASVLPVTRQTTSFVSRSRKPPENAWMLPLTSRRFDAYVSKFYQMAKEWLGESDFEPEVMQDLVEKVKKPIDRNLAKWAASNGTLSEEFFSRGGHRYESCAVVGNSGILLKSRYGAEIDSHEMVIRLNNAENFRFKEHVGAKTTLSFMNSNILHWCSRRPGCWCHPYGEQVPIILYICQAQHLMHVAMCNANHKSPLLVTNSLLDILCARIVKWYSLKNFVETTGRGVDEWGSAHHSDYFHYSSGMQAIVLALGICDSVDIYGFGKSTEAKHHYHTDQKEELSLHDYQAEYIFYDDLVHNRTIPFLNDAGISIPPVRIYF